MDYKEKYEALLEKAREIMNNECSSDQTKTICQEFFPELAESEDERIRKAIVKSIEEDSSVYEQEVTKEQMLAYLERQKEDYSSFSEEERKYMEKYIPLDRITLVKLLAERDRINEEVIKSFDGLDEEKPIFKVGDTIIAKDGTCIPKELFHIEKIEDGTYWDGDSSILVCNQHDFQLINQQPVKQVTMRDFNYHEGESDKKAWSRLLAILNYAGATSGDTPGEEIQALINWIDGKQKEQKPLSTEETELNSLAFLGQLGYICVPPGAEQKLRKRLQWKPSKEQMNSLEWWCEHTKETPGGNKLLVSLYNDLKKL